MDRIRDKAWETRVFGRPKNASVLSSKLVAEREFGREFEGNSEGIRDWKRGIRVLGGQNYMRFLRFGPLGAGRQESYIILIRNLAQLPRTSSPASQDLPLCLSSASASHGSERPKSRILGNAVLASS